MGMDRGEGKIRLNCAIVKICQEDANCYDIIAHKLFYTNIQPKV